MGLNIRLKGYVYRQHVYTIRWGEWFYYNFAAGCFHSKKLCIRLYSIELEFYSQNNKFAFWEVRLMYALHL